MRKTKQQHEKLAKLLDAGTPVCAALEQAGWSKNQAAKGTSKVPLAVYGMLSKKAKRLIKLGQETNREDRRDLVFGRLIENTAKGSDKGALSAKILGSSADTNMWQPELQTGVIILQQPSAEQLAGLLERPEDLEK